MSLETESQENIDSNGMMNIFVSSFVISGKTTGGSIMHK